jgi:hypothetical protein
MENYGGNYGSAPTFPYTHQLVPRPTASTRRYVKTRAIIQEASRKRKEKVAAIGNRRKQSPIVATQKPRAMSSVSLFCIHPSKAKRSFIE